VEARLSLIVALELRYLETFSGQRVALVCRQTCKVDVGERLPGTVDYDKARIQFID
jgi:hypothetical protein